ncbi:MAG: aminopeptidase P family N-terminal domain-containing protein [Planctomycetota bacterium]
MAKTRTRRTRQPTAQEHRLRRLKRIVASKDADAALVTRERDVAYLTGFLGGDSVLLVPARGKPMIISDRRYEEAGQVRDVTLSGHECCVGVL